MAVWGEWWVAHMILVSAPGFHWVGIDNYYLLFYWCTHFINKKRDETDEQIAKIFSQYVQDRMKIEGSFHGWIDGQSYFLS